MINCIIIEDELLAQAALEDLLASYSNINVITKCNNGYEGLKAIQEHQPDLIFLDIQMPKITGFEMLELLEQTPKVIFTTAYDEYALKAFEINALDYLLKPINPERLAIAINRVLQPSEDNKNNVLTNNINLPEKVQRIVVKEQGSIKIIPLEQILYIEAANDYIKIHTKEKYYLKLQTMSVVENSLPENQFVRIHRSYLLNIAFLHRIEPMDKESYVARLLNNDTRLPISRSGQNLLKKALGI